MSAFRQQLQVFVDAELSPDARSVRFAAAAEAARDDLIGTGQASARYDTYVDGAPGRPEETAARSIVYLFNYVSIAAGFALGYLRARSPVRTGRFRDSFMVAVDGRPIPAASFNPASVPQTAEIIIYNPLPYARKVDVQRTGKVVLNFSVPPGLYDDGASATQRAYSGVVKARRLGNVSHPGAMVRIHGGALIQTPALVINPVT